LDTVLFEFPAFVLAVKDATLGCMHGNIIRNSIKWGTIIEHGYMLSTSSAMEMDDYMAFTDCLR
jgi:hypothetical protein